MFKAEILWGWEWDLLSNLSKHIVLSHTWSAAPPVSPCSRPVSNGLVPPRQLAAPSIFFPASLTDPCLLPDSDSTSKLPVFPHCLHSYHGHLQVSRTHPPNACVPFTRSVPSLKHKCRSTFKEKKKKTRQT